MQVIPKAYKFAKKAHMGQTRWGGEDYFDAHCQVVADYVITNYHDLFPRPAWKNWLMPDIHECVVAAAYLHDVLEDTQYTLEEFPQLTQDIVRTLTKRKGENYFDYIMRVHDCGSITVACRAIKIADLRCNMMDLKEGSMKDKYRLAEYILSQGL